MTNAIYLLQLPYLNEDGKPVVITINKYDAEMLRDNGSHKFLKGVENLFVVTPRQAAATNVTFQIGNPAL